MMIIIATVHKMRTEEGKTMTQHIHVETVAQAWEQADRLFPTDYMKDDGSSERAGYDVYRSTAKDCREYVYDTICDLGRRLEVNLCTLTAKGNWKSKTINIWIDFIERTSEGFRICGAED